MKRKHIFLLIFLLLFISIYSSYDFFKLKWLGSHEFVMTSDKDNMYNNILLVKKHKEKQEFDKLITFLLSKQNVDLLSKEMAIRYVKENKNKVYISHLKDIQKEFQNIPLDSVWTYNITESKYRSNKLKNANIVPLLDEAIKSLEK